MRHPGDTCVSYYHFYRLFDGYKGTLEDFCELFLQGMSKLHNDNYKLLPKYAYC